MILFDSCGVPAPLVFSIAFQLNHVNKYIPRLSAGYAVSTPERKSGADYHRRAPCGRHHFNLFVARIADVNISGGINRDTKWMAETGSQGGYSSACCSYFFNSAAAVTGTIALLPAASTATPAGLLKPEPILVGAPCHLPFF